MHLSDLSNAAPLIVAVMVCANSVMVGIYAAFSKVLDSAKNYPNNKYLATVAVFAKALLKILDVLGYHPVRQDVKEAIQENKQQIEAVKEKNGLI